MTTETAVRISGVLNMTCGDVNFDNRWVRLWTRKRRRGDVQEDKLAITDDFYKVLYRKNRYIKDSGSSTAASCRDIRWKYGDNAESGTIIGGIWLIEENKAGFHLQKTG